MIFWAVLIDLVFATLALGGITGWLLYVLLSSRR